MVRFPVELQDDIKAFLKSGKSCDEWIQPYPITPNTAFPPEEGKQSGWYWTRFTTDGRGDYR
jgi:hypothetical protein